MDAGRSVLDRVTVIPRVVVHRSRVAAGALGEILRQGGFEPEDGGVCDLEAGGVVIARGRVVRRGGSHWFQIVEMGKET